MRHERKVLGGAEEEGQDEYLLALESSDMANLCADVAALGFLGGVGVTPGRLLRVAHALTRVAVMTLSGKSMLLAACLVRAGEYHSLRAYSGLNSSSLLW